MNYAKPIPAKSRCSTNGTSLPKSSIFVKPSYVKLAVEEKLLRVVRPSFLNYLFGFLTGVFLLLLSITALVVAMSSNEIALYLTMYIVSATFLITGSLLFLHFLLVVKMTEFTITNKRVIAKGGWISVNIVEVQICDIRGVNFSRGVWQAIIGTGNVVIGTAATGDVEMVVSGVKNAMKILEQINDLRHSNTGIKNAKRVTTPLSQSDSNGSGTIVYDPNTHQYIRK